MLEGNNNLATLYAEMADSLPRFEDGRIDYHRARKALVVTVVVHAGGRVLILKRSQQVGEHRGLWSAVTGYFDRDVSAIDIALAEFEEELGFSRSFIRQLSVARPHEVIDEIVGTTWVNVPVVIDLTHAATPCLDWEHEDFAWIQPSELSDYELVSEMADTIRNSLELLTANS
jgi:8-oxo-dGTP pyrophosphatase MutT (NUDIX family)